MDKETMIKLYGTDDEGKIAESKNGRQDRVFTSGIEKAVMSIEDIQKLCKKAKIEYLEGYESRVFKYRFTDSTVDWYGDIVDAKGANLKVFQKQHPVILAFHDYKTLPVGACLDVWYDKEAEAIDGHVLFFDDRVDRTGFSDTVYRFVASGGMRACSIGFMPDEKGVYRPTDEERAMWKMGKYGVKFTKWTLLELSVCPVPANPSAGQRSFNTLAEARSAEIIDDVRLTEIAKAIDETDTEVLQAGNVDVSIELGAASVADAPLKITIESDELKDMLTEALNKINIMSNKINDLQDAVDKISTIQKKSDPVLHSEPESKDDEDIYSAVLGGSVDFLRTIKKL